MPEEVAEVVETSPIEEKEEPLFFAVYARRTKSGNITYVGFPKRKNDKGRYVKAQPKNPDVADYVSLVFGAEPRDEIFDIAQDNEGVFPAYIMLPTKFSVKLTLDIDGNPIKTKKDGKSCHTMFVMEADFIEPVPEIRVDINTLF